MRFWQPFLIIWVLLYSSALAKNKQDYNVVLIFVDDVGYNDFGCYGADAKHIKTPNIDEIALEGIRFTNWISAANTCCPSRAALLTGRYPMRCGVPSDTNGTGAFGLEYLKHVGLAKSEITIAELFKKKGYSTAMYGKSHLGFSSKFFPRQLGFDEYYGSLSNFPIGGGSPIWKNETLVHRSMKFQEIHERLTQHTIAFMKKSVQEKKPFFIYLSHYLAHGPWAPNRKFMTDKEWEIYQNLRIKGHIAYGGHQMYPGLIRELDHHVGKVMKSIKSQDIEDETIVILVSDNGAHIPAGSVIPLRGSKFNTFEGGHRVPSIVWSPSIIPGKQVSNRLCSTMDIFPTLVELCALNKPPQLVIDGLDLSDTLKGDKNALGHEVLYYYGGTKLEAVREKNWKLHLPRTPEQMVYWTNQKLGGLKKLEKPILMNLNNDIAEKKNVADRFPKIVSRLLKHAEKARHELGDWNRQGMDQRAHGYSGFINQPKRVHNPKFSWLKFLEEEGKVTISNNPKH